MVMSRDAIRLELDKGQKVRDSGQTVFSSVELHSFRSVAGQHLYFLKRTERISQEAERLESPHGGLSQEIKDDQCRQRANYPLPH